MTDSLFFFFGFGSIFFGLKISEDVHQIALLVTGFICLVWGFAMSSVLLQLLLMIFLAGFLRLSH
ncbi:hypothetical protein IQ235_11300 [Oscillatoriales cyanobacterium LEGE 11467]|uniref:Uncharacterized protein n=1 Tax=Zarconia navalis LEGE 11467 TaxID=1828826 RepID=A0A928VW68_9CYAN|nr:hypothetical protein [Zarconia navalis]MBE9041367.1 hypothetical protein [Zarconia navalis LEGE 11467]